MQRERQIKSGKLLEIDFYPIFDDGRKMPTRAPKTKKSTPEQQKYNATQATKKFVRLVNANFTNTDIFLGITFPPQIVPQTEAEARRWIVNYLRRAKARREAELRRIEKKIAEAGADAELLAKRAKLAEPLRYIYVIERETYKRGEYKGRDNWHYHLFISGGLDRDTMEDLCGANMRVNARRFMPERFGPEAAARYCAKDPQGSKRFCYSRNLKKPVEKTRDGKITDRGVEKLATQKAHDRTFWEKRHKGYKFVRSFARYNDFNGHWYVTAIMYRAEAGEEIPPWTRDDWQEEF